MGRFAYRPEMTSTRPYLIRGLYEWILDNGQTPYLLIDAEHENLISRSSAACTASASSRSFFNRSAVAVSPLGQGRFVRLAYQMSSTVIDAKKSKRYARMVRVAYQMFSTVIESSSDFI